MSGRTRFTLSDNIALAKEVMELNPFLDTANWLKIADRLCELMDRSFSRVADLARKCSYSSPRSTMRLLDKADGGKRPKRNQAALAPAPQQRRVVDNRHERAVAAYAELTAGDGFAPGNK
ncbi:hypothetical protein HPB52_019400 [Rhipicephalus sanguineus]|uniref:Uncharacterized protein n=1 Tax=Rhipicephalus sanguineus TaxID=34632 RepID=A0A9D4SUY4_RHISA|nr:hypothetical protein HPB52_019400 [Rhipicephalus sanguineus]